MSKIFILVIVIFVQLSFHEAWAGPPFLTDDPQPVDYLHWEFYVASAQEYGGAKVDATSPHIEVNYGVIPNVQLHIIAPMRYVKTNENTVYGYSDTEIGVKYRFLKESESVPQIGIFPQVELPTGKEGSLGNGDIQTFLPIWFQKSWGKFTTYGGGGFWYNRGNDRKNWAFTGWEFQYDFSDMVTLGGELYFRTPDSQNAGNKRGFNFGGYINIDNSNHILLSFGHSIADEELSAAYVGYLLTI